MLVQVKLFANLQRYWPSVPAGQATPINLPEGSTVGDLIRHLAIRENEIKVTFVNGRARAELYRLKEGDEVGIFPPVGGG
ncbi:MAG TPA: MoaD/ThiS family protein [Anaerolineae bacterium]|nr:MoaD/ThiS family protein [Anaerolineae bacterium]